MRPIHAVACLLLFAGAAGAQSTDPAEAPNPTPQASPAGPPRFIYNLAQTIDAHGVPHIGGGGDANTTRTRTEFTITWLASDSTRVNLQLSNEFAFYDFEGARGLDQADGDPFRGFNRQNADLLAVHAIDERWSVLGLAGIGLAREGNADAGDAVIGRLGAGFAYQLTPAISLGVSLLVASELEGNAQVIPLPQIDATFALAERWSLRLATIEGATLAYQHNEQLAFQLKAGYEERQFRLDDEGFAPEGVFQDKSIDLNLGVLWTPTPALEVNAGLAFQPWRRFKIQDRDGNRLSRAETDPTIGLYAGVSYRF